MQTVYVLTAQKPNEDEACIYVFQDYADACYKAFEHFDMAFYTEKHEEQLKELQDWLFEYGLGEFEIYRTNIQ